MKGRVRYLVLLIFTIILVAPSFAPQDPQITHLEQKLMTPGSPAHWLGTDGDGRDLFSQLLFGARVSLVISVSVVSVCLILGFLAGFGAGYFGGWWDRIFLMMADIFQAFPGILLAITLAAFLPPSFFNLIILLTLAGWVSYARLIRAQVLELKTRDYVAAARALGVGTDRLMLYYFLPNLAGPLVVQASFGMAGAILAESTLSFLGLGLPAHITSLGKILDGGVNLLLRAPHVSLFPGFVIMLFVLAFNSMGDRLRSRVTGN